MATHAGVALELGITRPGATGSGLKMMSPQMEAILIWCQCRTRNYKVSDSSSSSRAYTMRYVRIGVVAFLFLYSVWLAKFPFW